MNELTKSVQLLRMSLDAIEPFLTDPKAPRSDLENFKATLDRIRTNVQAISSAESSTGHSERINEFRLQRAAQVCRSVQSDLTKGISTTNAEGFDRLCPRVTQTLQALTQLHRRA